MLFALPYFWFLPAPLKDITSRPPGPEAPLSALPPRLHEDIGLPPQEAPASDPRLWSGSF
jgi:hypothetical protein